MLRLGLTGGIGSGKSTAAQMLVANGATLIDADKISRAVTAPGGAAMAQIGAQFGILAIAADGAMNRDAMRQLVFANPTARHRLEAIIHPLVSSESAREAELARLAGCPLLVFDVPLLVESGRWRQQLDRVLVIDCDEATQMSRVIQRSGWTRLAVENVMAEQASRAQRLAAADVVIYNQNVTLSELACLINTVFHRLTL